MKIISKKILGAIPLVFFILFFGYLFSLVYLCFSCGKNYLLFRSYPKFFMFQLAMVFYLSLLAIPFIYSAFLFNLNISPFYICVAILLVFLMFWKKQTYQLDDISITTHRMAFPLDLFVFHKIAVQGNSLYVACDLWNRHLLVEKRNDCVILNQIDERSTIEHRLIVNDFLSIDSKEVFIVKEFNFDDKSYVELRDCRLSNQG